MQPLKIGFAWLVVGGQVMLASAATATAGEHGTLAHTSWTLASLPGRSLIAGRAATLNFADGRVQGNDGCNSYSGPYTVTGDQLRIDQNLLSTRMACPAPVMRQAEDFTGALGKARTFRRDARQLLLLDADDRELATLNVQRGDLAATSWQVTGYHNGTQGVVSALAGSELTMNFAADGRRAGSAGCNNYTASYSTAAQTIQIGDAATTPTMCSQPDGLMDQESGFLRALASAERWRLAGDRLDLRTAAGALALTLSATHDPAAAPNPAVGTRLVCGDQEITVTPQAEALQLKVGDKSLTMQPVRTASGAKYVADGDHTTTFWSKNERATLVVGGQTYPECALAPTATLPGGEWVVEDLNKAGIIDSSRATLSFGSDGRISGRAFCNTYTGGYRLAGETLAISLAGMTRNACAPALMNQEAQFVEVLKALRRFSVSPDGALILQSEDGRSILARRR